MLWASAHDDFGLSKEFDGVMALTVQLPQEAVLPTAKGAA